VLPLKALSQGPKRLRDRPEKKGSKKFLGGTSLNPLEERSFLKKGVREKKCGSARFVAPKPLFEREEGFPP